MKDKPPPRRIYPVFDILPSTQTDSNDKRVCKKCGGRLKGQQYCERCGPQQGRR